MHDCEHILNVEKQWTPVQDEMLILKCKPTNTVDRNVVAVAIQRRSNGWQCSFQLSMKYFRRDITRHFSKIVGEKVNREAGYGLEIACMKLVDSFWPYI